MVCKRSRVIRTGLLLGALALHTGMGLGAALGQLWVLLLGSGLLVVIALRLHTDLVRASLQWALHAQAQDAARTTILRAREAALTTALRDRDQAQRRLERLNRDLIQAREAADEANRLKTRFLATMSHELRTPLNTIIGFSEILPRYGPLVERQQHLLGRITQNGEHLLGLINDILWRRSRPAGWSSSGGPPSWDRCCAGWRPPPAA